jgi:hypothetical protein
VITFSISLIIIIIIIILIFLLGTMLDDWLLIPWAGGRGGVRRCKSRHSVPFSAT